MIRHQSLLELGELGEFLQDERPRHVYFSAGRYRQPGAGTMAEKDWQGSDLIFDLDADHLPGVDPNGDSYRDMLDTCKDALIRLLSVLREDFGFDDLTVVFSGGRGYHVHVRDPGVRSLSRDARQEIVEYVRGSELDFDALISTETIAGLGRSTPTEKRTLDPAGGWSRRVHRRLQSFLKDLLSDAEEDAIDRLREFEGIGEKKAASALRAARENFAQIEQGNIDVHPAVYSVAKQYFEHVRATESVAIDEPVTTDIHRLIRLPGSLHGGTALMVTPIELETLDAFDPLTDAVPDTFTGHEIRIQADGGPPVELGGETFTVPDGVITLPEYVAMFLMASDRAEKEKEKG